MDESKQWRDNHTCGQVLDWIMTGMDRRILIMLACSLVQHRQCTAPHHITYPPLAVVRRPCEFHWLQTDRTQAVSSQEIITGDRTHITFFSHSTRFHFVSPGSAIASPLFFRRRCGVLCVLRVCVCVCVFCVCVCLGVRGHVCFTRHFIHPFTYSHSYKQSKTIIRSDCRGGAVSSL